MPGGEGRRGPHGTSESRKVPGGWGEWTEGRVCSRRWPSSSDGRPQEVLAQPNRPHRRGQVPVHPSQKRCPPPGLTPVAEGQPSLLPSLDVGHPQVTAVDEGEESGVGRADLGVHPGPGTLSLDLQGLHGGHLGTERAGSAGQDPGRLPAPPPAKD